MHRNAALLSSQGKIIRVTALQTEKSAFNVKVTRAPCSLGHKMESVFIFKVTVSDKRISSCGQCKVQDDSLRGRGHDWTDEIEDVIGQIRLGDVIG